MATYIQGLTDYIPQIQPFQPDYNFYGNVMQTRQNRYDDAKKQVSQLYGTLLNSPMLRESNIKRRDEYFKAIDQDIKKISGMDLSLQQNQDAALGVFKGFYDDKNMVNDMVKTKKAYSQIEKGKSFKNCTDPKKCGGQYWEPGMQKLYYKMDEFKNASNDEALNFDIGEYDAYYDWKKDAVKAAKEQGYSVERDHITNEWIVKESGGKLLQGGLYSFFKSMYGDDPRVSSNYNTMAYVARKNAAKSDAIKYGSEEEAEKQYIMKSVNKGLTDLDKTYKNISASYDQINSKFNELENKRKSNAGLTPKEQAEYDQITSQKDYISQSKNSVEETINNIKNNIDANDINSLRQRADNSTANSYEISDMEGLAKSLAEMNQKIEYRPNPYGEIRARESSEARLAKVRAYYDLQKLEYEYGLKKNYKEFEHALETGQIASETDQEGIVNKEAPETVIDLDIENNPEAGYQRSQKSANESMQEASNSSTDVLYKMMSSAKNAYATRKSAGALQFLQQFGDWNSIDSPEELKNAIYKKKMTPISLFNSTMLKASSKTNPTGDYSWAQSVINSNNSQIGAAKAANEAYHAMLANNLNANKKVVKTMQSMASTSNSVARFSNLLLTENGFRASEKDFINKYIDANRKLGNDVSEDDGEYAFKLLNKQFSNVYNRAEGLSLEQPKGILKKYAGAGMLQGSSLEYQTLDAGKKTRTFNDIINTANSALNNMGASKVVLGDATKDNLAEDDDPKMRSLIAGLINKARVSTSKTQDRPVFNAKVNSVAGNNENMSSITFKNLSPEFVRDYVGTKDNPGPLYKTDLSKGVTLFYDNRKIYSPFKRGAEMTNIEKVLKVKNRYRFDAYQDDAGIVDYVYDGENVKATMNYEYYDKSGKLANGINIRTFPMSDMKNNEEIMEKALQQLQSNNLKTAAAIAASKRQ
jgi:uncharacterized protein YnzC (UPF0291/DUF896 family)